MTRRHVRVVFGIETIALVVALVVAACSPAPDPGIVGAEELVASLRKRSIPGLPDPLTPEKAKEIAAMRAGSGAWFVDNGCFACHAVSVYDVKPLTAVGPDLATAVDDVEARFGMPLEKFMQEPVGTMSLVLTEYIPLSDAEKAVAIEKLRAAYAEYQKQKAAR
jgi:hypothetical protein